MKSPDSKTKFKTRGIKKIAINIQKSDLLNSIIIFSKYLAKKVQENKKSASWKKITNSEILKIPLKKKGDKINANIKT